MIKTHKGWQFESADAKGRAEAAKDPKQTKMGNSPSSAPRPYKNKALDSIESGFVQAKKIKTGIQNQGKQIASQIQSVKKTYPNTYNAGVALVGAGTVAGLMGLLTGKKPISQATVPVPPRATSPILNAPPRKGVVDRIMNSVDQFLNKRRW